MNKEVIFIQGSLDKWIIMSGTEMVGLILKYKTGSHSDYPYYALGLRPDGELVNDFFSSLSDAQSAFL